MNAFKIFTVPVTLLLISACAGDTKKDSRLDGAIPPEANAKNSVSIEAKLAAAQDDTQNVTEVKFLPGHDQMNTENLAKIEKAIAEAGKRAKVKHIFLVVWSDSEMSMKDQKSLPSADIELANRRANSLEKYIQSAHQGIKIRTVNMAEKPSAINQFLKTNDVRIQEALEGSGKDNPKAGHAVVIIKTGAEKNDKT